MDNRMTKMTNDRLDDDSIVAAINAALSAGGDDQDWDAPEFKRARELTEGYVWEFTNWRDTAALIRRGKLKR
jgi:hypothetical protein